MKAPRPRRRPCSRRGARGTREHRRQPRSNGRRRPPAPRRSRRSREDDHVDIAAVRDRRRATARSPSATGPTTCASCAPKPSLRLIAEVMPPFDTTTPTWVASAARRPARGRGQSAPRSQAAIVRRLARSRHDREAALPEELPRPRDRLPDRRLAARDRTASSTGFHLDQRPRPARGQGVAAAGWCPRRATHDHEHAAPCARCRD